MVSSNFWQYCSLSVIDLSLLITPLVSSNFWPKTMKDREHNGNKFEDTKEINRKHKTMKDREHNGQKFEDNKRFNQKTQINEGQRTQWPKV
jgi:hypothetical protein